MVSARILVGVIGRPHGVRGLVHVQSYTAEPADLSRYAPLRDEAGRTWSLAWRAAGVAEIAELRDGAAHPVRDRDAAARLTNVRLSVDRAQLPAPDEDEFYLADLVGLDAADRHGAALGRVTAVHDYGAGAILEIARDAGAMLLPFTRAAVPDVNLAARRLTIVPPDEIVVEDAP